MNFVGQKINIKLKVRRPLSDIPAHASAVELVDQMEMKFQVIYEYFSKGPPDMCLFITKWAVAIANTVELKQGRNGWT